MRLFLNNTFVINWLSALSRRPHCGTAELQGAMRGPRRLVHSQNPLPQNPFQFSDRL